MKVVCASWNYKDSIHIENKRYNKLTNIGTFEAQSYTWQYYDYAAFVIEQKCLWTRLGFQTNINRLLK
jgi:hypothetical protein